MGGARAGAVRGADHRPSGRQGARGHAHRGAAQARARGPPAALVIGQSAAAPPPDPGTLALQPLVVWRPGGRGEVRAPQVADLLEEVEWLAPRLAAVLRIDVEVLPPLRLDDRHTREVSNPWAPRRSQLTQLHARAAFDALLGCRASFRDDYQRRHVLAVTEADLWPGGSLRYVFGLGSGEIQTGVMSLARLALDVPANAADAAIVRERMSDPDVLERARFRALKIAAHEALHLWDLDHCPVPDDPPAGHPGQALLAAGRNVEDLDALELAMCPEHARQWAAIRSGSGDRYTHLRP